MKTLQERLKAAKLKVQRAASRAYRAPIWDYDKNYRANEARAELAAIREKIAKAKGAEVAR